MCFWCCSTQLVTTTYNHSYNVVWQPSQWQQALGDTFQQYLYLVRQIIFTYLFFSWSSIFIPKSLGIFGHSPKIMPFCLQCRTGLSFTLNLKGSITPESALSASPCSILLQMPQWFKNATVNHCLLYILCSCAEQISLKLAWSLCHSPLCSLNAIVHIIYKPLLQGPYYKELSYVYEHINLFSYSQWNWHHI